MLKNRTFRRLGLWLCGFIVALGIAHLVLHSDQKALEERFGAYRTRWFDMNSEFSIATWFNVTLLVLVAALAAVAAVAGATPRIRLAWGSLAVAVALLSLDEKVSIHEVLPELLGMARGTLATHEWLVPGIIIALIGLGVLAFLMRPLPRPAVVGLLAAAAVYGVGAVGVELVTGLATRSLEITHPIRVLMPVWEVVEESLEMLGCVIAITTLLAHLRRTGVYDPDRWRALSGDAEADVAVAADRP